MSEGRSGAGGRMSRRALVIGGTGMLSPAVQVLADEGYEVFRPSRGQGGTGGWIKADWTDPSRFARIVTQHVGHPVDLFVLWAHRPYRAEIAPLLRPLVGPATVVVEVIGSAQFRDTGEDRDIAGSRLVVLGRAAGTHGERWLTHAEISEGVLDARHAPPGAVRFVGTAPV
ncbi:hypothetical protein ACFQ8O_01290 [Streptomyces coelicoflavus]|uniref:hypothetical protein n=1 Tax=Streptomyces coelicoflavus TaxID=285562 RepID=UPI0036923352